MSRANPTWKVLLALLALVLAVAVWVVALVDSLNRPSVTATLSLQQQEMALLAEPAVPVQVRPLLVGTDPQQTLRKALSDIPLVQLDDRQRLTLAALTPIPDERSAVLGEPPASASLIPLQDALLARSGGPPELTAAEQRLLVSLDGDPLLMQLSCRAFGGRESDCVDRSLSQTMALRLLLSSGLPALALLVGSGLLLRHLWLLVRRSMQPWPALIAMPLSLTDMVLLVAGGFVLLGEVLAPVIVSPLSAALTRGVESPLSEALTVLIGYATLAVPPLLILWQQMKSVGAVKPPVDGWLQWRFRPWGSAFLKGGRGWLMVMPPVILTAWLIGTLVGDQGGSNPLLELVFRSRDPFAQVLLATTAVVLAPLFEEVVFRGVLLPVLGTVLGRGWGVILSALVFAVAHLSIGELPPLLVLGLGLAMLRLSTGRLFPCVVMHALWNAFTFVNLVLLGG